MTRYMIAIALLLTILTGCTSSGQIGNGEVINEPAPTGIAYMEVLEDQTIIVPTMAGFTALWCNYSAEEDFCAPISGFTLVDGPEGWEVTFPESTWNANAGAFVRVWYSK